MHLKGVDGSIVELSVTGYQFPSGLDLPSGRHVEPDWLNVEGRVVVDGRSWNWAFPCLNADEATELGAWLDAVSRRQSVRARIDFTEPNVSIEVIGHSDGAAHLRFFFSQEACPPSQPDDVRLGDGYPVDMMIRPEVLAAGADAWRSQIAPFPARTSSCE